MVLIALYVLRNITGKKLIVGLGAVWVALIIGTVTDASLSTKFSILENSTNYLMSASTFEQMFGIGLGRSPEVFSRSTHILVLTYLVESGVVGLTCFLVWIWACLRAKRYVGLYIVPVGVASLSYFLYSGAAFFTVPLAIVVSVSYVDFRAGWNALRVAN